MSRLHQSPKAYARELAMGMADGTIEHLPRFTAKATPEFVRECLWAFYAMRDALPAIRAEGAGSRTLRERIALASVALEVESAIRDANVWLSRRARRGGRDSVGVAHADAPRSTRAGRGSKAVASDAPIPSPAADITSNGDRLSFSPKGQELPPTGMHADNRNVEGVAV